MVHQFLYIKRRLNLTSFRIQKEGHCLTLYHLLSWSWSSFYTSFLIWKIPRLTTLIIFSSTYFTSFMIYLFETKNDREGRNIHNRHTHTYTCGGVCGEGREGKEREGEDSYPLAQFPSDHNRQAQSLPKVGSLELHMNLPCGWHFDIRLAVMVLQCLFSINMYFSTKNGTQSKRSDTGVSDMPKRRCEVLSLSEKVKVLTVWKEKIVHSAC